MQLEHRERRRWCREISAINRALDGVPPIRSRFDGEPMARQDPLRGFRYLVEIDGLAGGAFLRVKGLSREVRHRSYREGGVNDYEHKLLTQVTYPSLSSSAVWRSKICGNGPSRQPTATSRGGRCACSCRTGERSRLGVAD
ncbi:MAG: phage tail protein [Burkholderiales bacterium]